MSNPVVYSRNGKMSYTDGRKTEGRFTFTAKDLQKYVDEPSIQRWDWQFMGSKEKVQPYYVPTDPADSTLVFESRFESGNLGLAIKVRAYEYVLLMQNDTQTKGNTQCTFQACISRVLLQNI